MLSTYTNMQSPSSMDCCTRSVKTDKSSKLAAEPTILRVLPVLWRASLQFLSYSVDGFIPCKTERSVSRPDGASERMIV
jgi:hypothetical protein